MKIFLTIVTTIILMSLNSVFAESIAVKVLETNRMIKCSSEPVTKYVPIKGFHNSSLFYAVLINHKEKKYQLISDDNNNIKCVFN